MVVLSSTMNTIYSVGDNVIFYVDTDEDNGNGSEWYEGTIRAIDNQGRIRLNYVDGNVTRLKVLESWRVCKRINSAVLDQLVAL